jgi:hypothetical protein
VVAVVAVPVVVAVVDVGVMVGVGTIGSWDIPAAASPALSPADSPVARVTEGSGWGVVTAGFTETESWFSMFSRRVVSFR